MAERPIIFSGSMVKAILDGRKTMTRRLLKPQPEPFALPDGSLAEVAAIQVEGEQCPRIALGRVLTRQKVRFAVGDRLWVRETWADVNTDSGPALLYRSTGEYHFCQDDAFPIEYGRYPGCTFTMWGGDLLRGAPDHPWRTPIFMPRWASRITLAVTAVKVERLQDITIADALAEGALESDLPYVGAMTCDQARVAFSLLWDSLHGKQSWEENPWVVAVSLKRADG